MYGEAVNSPGTDRKCERALNQRLAISIAACQSMAFYGETRDTQNCIIVSEHLQTKCRRSGKFKDYLAQLSRDTSFGF